MEKGVRHSKKSVQHTHTKKQDGAPREVEGWGEPCTYVMNGEGGKQERGQTYTTA